METATGTAAMNKTAISVWKDGTWKQWTAHDAALAQDDHNWIATIPLETPDAERFREALTPSAATKADYIGEFKFIESLIDQDGEERAESFTVPWTTIKEIMAHILKRATPSPPPAEGEG